jgi:hypothetical protein
MGVGSNNYGLPKNVIFKNLTNLDTPTKYIWKVTRPTYTKVLLYGTIGTIIPAGSKIKSVDDDSLHFFKNDTTIRTTAIEQCLIIINDVLNETEYSITLRRGVSEETFSYISSSDASALEIITALNALIIFSGLNSYLYTEDSILIYGQEFDIDIDEKMNFASDGEVQSVIEDDTHVGSNELNIIVDEVSGFTGVNNRSAGFTGFEVIEEKFDKSDYTYILNRDGFFTVTLSTYDSEDTLMGEEIKIDYFQSIINTGD